MYLPRCKKFLNQLSMRSGSLRSIVRRYSHWRTDIYVVSYHKSGRTWLRMMLAKAFSMVNHDNSDIVGRTFVEYSKYVPTPGKKLKITYTHDGSMDCRISELERDKRRYRDKRVLLLVRDPRDVMVSAYFEMTKRRGFAFTDMSAFLRDDIHGIAKLIAYMNIWAENRDVPSSFLLVRYEDLATEPLLQLTRVLEFVGLQHMPDHIIRESVEFARFDKMQELERSLTVPTFELRPADAKDPESFKVRQGKVGGYKHYLTQIGKDFIDTQINQHLSEYFAYYRASE